MKKAIAVLGLFLTLSVSSFAQEKKPVRKWPHVALLAADSLFTNLDLHITRDYIRFPQYGESNPLWRPLMPSPGVYAAGAATNVGWAALGWKMHTSKHRWIRSIWWAPQATDIAMHAWGWQQWAGTRHPEKHH
jgi:hypothetical protein